MAYKLLLLFPLAWVFIKLVLLLLLKLILYLLLVIELFIFELLWLFLYKHASLFVIIDILLFLIWPFNFLLNLFIVEFKWTKDDLGEDFVVFELVLLGEWTLLSGYIFLFPWMVFWFVSLLVLVLLILFELKVIFFLFFYLKYY